MATVTVYPDQNMSIPGACKVFKLVTLSTGVYSDMAGADTVILTGFSPMDLAAPKWKASTYYNIGDMIQDSNSNFQRCTTAGISGTAAPTWQTSSTTTDNTGGGTVVWTFFSAYIAPQFGNAIPDPYQVRVRAYAHSNTSPSTTVGAAIMDAATWQLYLTDTTHTSITFTLICAAETGVVIIEVPAA